MAGMEGHHPSSPRLRNRRRSLASVTAVAVAVLSLSLIVACTGEGEAPVEPVTTPDRQAPSRDDFPSAAGHTLGEIIDQADPPKPSDPVLSARAQVFYPGLNRYSLTIADRDHREVTDAELAIYIAPIPKSGSAENEPALGPFPARLVSLATDPEFRSENTAENPYSATAYYLADIEFPASGQWRIEALVRDRGRLVSKSMPRGSVGSYDGIPTVGSQPPRIATPTPEMVGGDLSALTTRRPDGGLNAANFADVLGERPVALLFTSPAFCQSRVCSVVTDVAAQVSSELGEEVEVIQMELYNNNDPDMGVRPQVRRYNLPSDTWLFVMDTDGTVRQAVEGPFAVGEMQTWLEEASRR